MIKNNKEIFKRINKEFLPNLKNVNYPNKKFLIGFSGIPSSGKTSIAKKLEERYKGVRIRSDDVRKIIAKEDFLKTPEENEELLEGYIFGLIENCPFKNGLLILDNSLDRKYKRFFDLCKSKKLEFFIIRLDFSGEEAINRIINREKVENMGDLYKSMEKWVRDYNDFGKNARYDILLDGRNPDLNKLYRKLDKILL